MRYRFLTPLLAASILVAAAGCAPSVTGNVGATETVSPASTNAAVSADVSNGTVKPILTPTPAPVLGAPVKIDAGEFWATKCYMNDWVENPSGTRLLYRYFSQPGDQPSSRTDQAFNAQMWVCGPLGDAPNKLFDIPENFSELGHGSESMIWIDDGTFYYNGILYRFGEGIVWKIVDPVSETVTPQAWGPAHDNWLYVNVRSGSNAGYYRINVSSPFAPPLVKVIGRAEIAPFFGGDASNQQFTYFKLSPGGTHVYFVMYDGSKEVAFTANADGTDIARLGETGKTDKPFNGHTIWFDDDTLIWGSSAMRATATCDRFGNGVATVCGLGNHITLSPDRKWLAADVGNSSVVLYRIGEVPPVAQLMTPELYGGFTDPHPSFSRDGKGVYFMARYGKSSNAVWYVDVTGWTHE
jgi:hypothetical protein